MKEYEVTVRAYQTIKVSALDYISAMELALSDIDPDDWEDFEVDEVNCLTDFHEDYCVSCMNCGSIDEDCGLITCIIDQVPNGHKIGHHCCLYEEKEERV